MNWEFDGEFSASMRNEDGTITVRTFTSHAQARQFVENQNDTILAVRVTPQRPQANAKPNSVPPITLTPEQKELKNAALKRFKGL